MIRVLIIDDNNIKLIKIVEAIRLVYTDLIIDTAIDLLNAKIQLNSNIYDLLILDIQLPNKFGGEIIQDGGIKLLRELKVSKSLMVPKYIIGLTAYKNDESSFSDIWPLIEFDSKKTAWLEIIKEYIIHISKVNKYEPTENVPIETIFLEGQTDLKLFKESLILFKPELKDKIQLKATKGGGAKWVERQIISWAFSLPKRKNSDNYIKAIGLFDNDESGNFSKSEINRIISSDTAQATTFKSFSLDYKYAKHLLPLLKKGIKIPIALEELFISKYWKYALSKNWLEIRNNNNDYIEDPKDWNKFSMSLEDYMKGKGLSEDELLYTWKFKNQYKNDFVDYILMLEHEEKIEALDSFRLLLEEFEQYLLNKPK